MSNFTNQNIAKGIVHFVGEAQQVSERFSKRTIVLDMTDNEKYPQFVEFQATGKRCGILDGYRVGDDVEIAFNLRGKEWRKTPKDPPKYFVTLDISKITAVGTRAGADDYVPDQDPTNGEADPWAGL